MAAFIARLKMIGLYVRYTPASRYAILKAFYTLLLKKQNKTKQGTENPPRDASCILLL